MMRLVDFLILVLESHGNTLRDISAMIGKEALFEMLESQGDAPSTEEDPAQKEKDDAWWKEQFIDVGDVKPTGKGVSEKVTSYPYAELSSRVTEMKLPPMLEFHVWAYPFYRDLIEHSLDLTAHARPESVEQMVKRASVAAQKWVETLPLSVTAGRKAEQISKSCWLRFRSSCLKQSGRSVLSRVS